MLSLGSLFFCVLTSVHFSSHILEPPVPRDDHHSIFSSTVISSSRRRIPVLRLCRSENSISLNLGHMVSRRSQCVSNETFARRSHKIRPSGVSRGTDILGLSTVSFEGMRGCHKKGGSRRSSSGHRGSGSLWNWIGGSSLYRRVGVHWRRRV